MVGRRFEDGSVWGIACVVNNPLGWVGIFCESSWGSHFASARCRWRWFFGGFSGL